jgi:hypothetical protein
MGSDAIFSPRDFSWHYSEFLLPSSDFLVAFFGLLVAFFGVIEACGENSLLLDSPLFSNPTDSEQIREVEAGCLKVENTAPEFESYL